MFSGACYQAAEAFHSQRLRALALALLIPAVAARSRPTRRRGRDRKSPRARLVAFALVLVSLALVTVYFRESSDGALHETQEIGVSILAPFEIAGERMARPFQDAYGWTRDVLSAKDENAELKKRCRSCALL